MPIQLRPLLVASAIALLSLGAMACGSAEKASLPHTLPARDADSDIDSLGMVRRYDVDSDAVPTFGRTATASEKQAIGTLLERYYAAAVAGDGAQACSLTFRAFTELIVEEHRRGKGPPSLRGNTCAQIASKLFKQRHRELAGDVGRLELTIVQVLRNQAWAVLRFGPAGEQRVVQLRHERGSWKVDALFDSGPL